MEKENRIGISTEPGQRFRAHVTRQQCDTRHATHGQTNQAAAIDNQLTINRRDIQQRQRDQHKQQRSDHFETLLQNIDIFLTDHPCNKKRQQVNRTVDTERIQRQRRQQEQHRRKRKQAIQPRRRTQQAAPFQQADEDENAEHRLQEPEVVDRYPERQQRVDHADVLVHPRAHRLQHRERHADTEQRHDQPPHLAGEERGKVIAANLVDRIDVAGYEREQRHAHVHHRVGDDPERRADVDLQAAAQRADDVIEHQQQARQAAQGFDLQGFFLARHRAPALSENS